MTKKILHIRHAVVSRVDSLPRDKVGFFLFGIIFLSLVLYISMLNMAVSSAYRSHLGEKNLRLIRQDIEVKEEAFISKLSGFYETHASSFETSASKKAVFVSRDSNVAFVAGQILR